MGKTTRVFFVRNLLTFLIPMLIPILILGTLSSVIIQRFVTNEINPTNIHLLQQTKENIELVFNEQESLHLHIIASAVEFISLKSMLEKPYPDPEDYRRLASLKNFIDSPAIGRPYIDSIYIYVNNSRNRFVSSTTGGLVDLRDYYDQGWYDSYRAHSPQEEMWTESRTVSRPTIRNGTVDTGLITLYRRISVSDEKDGLIVLNVKRDYIEQLLSGPVSQSGQVLLILSPDNEVLTQSRDTVELNRPGLAYLNARQEPAFEWSPGNETLVVNKLHSDKYRWTFLSIVPKASLYELPDRLNQLTLTLLLLSFLSGTVLAYYLTKNNHKDLKTIIGVLDSAKNGRPLPPLPGQGKSVYRYILYSLISNFIEHNYLRIQLSERKFKAQALELAALQSQLNPHFLYNTLDTINWKAASLVGKPGELNVIIENLSDILRYSLEGSCSLVALRTEMAITLNYIEIQKIRYKEKFDVVWEYEEELLKYNVHKLMFQPLIENSIYHGIKEKEGKCRIKIRIGTSGSRLHIAVIDNGVGILPERLAQLRARLEDESADPPRSIGLINTQKRLKLTYGESFGIRLRSKFGWGTAIYLTIPID